MKNKPINNKQSNNNYIERYNDFMDGLEELSKKYGILICGHRSILILDTNDEDNMNKIKKLKYDKNPDSKDTSSNILGA